MPAETDNASKRLVLDELRTLFAGQFASFDTLDEKLRELLSSSSLILSVVATLQIAANPISKGIPFFAGLALALVLYIILLTIVLHGLRPQTFLHPVPPTWEEISDRYFHETEGTALDLLISAHLEYGPMNDAILSQKSRAVRGASRLLVAIVLVLVVIGVIGLLA